MLVHCGIGEMNMENYNHWNPEIVLCDLIRGLWIGDHGKHHISGGLQTAGCAIKSVLGKWNKDDQGGIHRLVYRG